MIMFIKSHQHQATEMVLFTKSDGPLSKSISLNADGTLQSDGSACIMSKGTAERLFIADTHALAGVLRGMKSNQALGLGVLRDDLSAEVRVTTKAQIKATTTGDLIARTADYIRFRDGSAFVLIDIDTKAMTQPVKARIEAAGDIETALKDVLPALSTTAGVIRASTSSGISRVDTGDDFHGSGGFHWYIQIAEGIDARRFLRTMHARCWLAGLGWMMVSGAGQLLERSLVDRTVGAPERLVFEGAPAIDTAKLKQDSDKREPQVIKGGTLNTKCQRWSKNASACRSKTTSQMVAARRPVRGALLRIGHLSGGLSTGAPRWRRLLCLSR